jgi:hypothetical protein|tara:strand:+ start:18962 stop:19147 length:186 start_codon:yes stop_codon:yes gene_type:complete
MSNDRLDSDAITDCKSIEALRAHVCACGFSGAWFDLNGYGTNVVWARVAARAALDQWTLGY